MRNCPPGKTYQPCGSLCLGNCRDIQLADPNCENKCVAGCSCPRGYLLDDEDNCVARENCTCYNWRNPAEIYHRGEFLVTECENW